jgi:hypothetical protein
MNIALRLLWRLACTLIPAACLIESRRPRLARAVTALWVLGFVVFFGLAAGPGLIAIFSAMAVAPFASA